MDTKKIRMPIDIFMTILSILLMGGTLLFPDEKVHQILGMILLALWICHTILNRKWYASLHKGKYAPYRIMQIIVNVSLSICAILLMISGMMMAWFVEIPFGLGFARITHLISSHWYYVFMCAHLGMHLGMIFSRIAKSRQNLSTEADVRREAKKQAQYTKIFLRILLLVICAYGVYAFIIRGIAKYMFLMQQFFFLDLERGFILFIVDYLSILILIATLSYYFSKFLQKRNKRLVIEN